MIPIVVGIHVIVEIRHVCQHPEFGIIQDLVSVHPENVGHGVGLRRGLQLGPVFVPAGDLHLNHHVGVHGLGICVADSLHGVPLVDVPDLEHQVRFPVRSAAAHQGEQHGRSHNGGENAGKSFLHNISPLIIFSSSFPHQRIL